MERTALLADNDHSDSYDETEGDVSKPTPTHAHFKVPIKILTILVSVLSIAIFVLLVASYVLLSVGPFQYTYPSQKGVRDLAICLFVNFILSIPTLFVYIPALVNMIIHIPMFIVIFVFSAEIFGFSWPNSMFCRKWGTSPGDIGPLPPDPGCIKALNVIRITMGTSAGISIIIGLLIVTIFSLRLTSLVRSGLWKGMIIENSQGLGGKPSGYTVQFTLNIMPQTPASEHIMNADATGPTSSAEENRLIDT